MSYSTTVVLRAQSQECAKIESTNDDATQTYFVTCQTQVMRDMEDCCKLMSHLQQIECRVRRTWDSADDTNMIGMFAATWSLEKPIVENSKSKQHRNGKAPGCCGFGFMEAAVRVTVALKQLVEVSVSQKVESNQCTSIVKFELEQMMHQLEWNVFELGCRKLKLVQCESRMAVLNGTTTMDARTASRANTATAVASQGHPENKFEPKIVTGSTGCHNDTMKWFRFVQCAKEAPQLKSKTKFKMSELMVCFMVNLRAGHQSGEF